MLVNVLLKAGKPVAVVPYEPYMDPLKYPELRAACGELERVLGVYGSTMGEGDTFTKAVIDALVMYDSAPLLSEELGLTEEEMLDDDQDQDQ